MPSLSSTSKRQVPQQERAVRRKSAFLAAAAEIMAKVGYDAATMTEIADRCNSSIGALYRYFPDKPSIVQALMHKYGLEIEEEWQCLLETSKDVPIREFAYELIDWMTRFVSDRPAYMPLINSPVKICRDSASRHNLRYAFSQAFLKRNPRLTENEGLIVANVAVQIVKGFTTLYAEVSAKDRKSVVAEFKKVLATYLEQVLEEP